MGPTLTQADIACLLAGPSAAARIEVADKLARQIDSTSLTATELQIAHDIVRLMAKDVEVAVRSALSHSLRNARQLPHDVALRLADDVEAVALPMLTASPVLTDADLVEVIQHGSDSKHEAIAGRAGVSEQVADALVSQAGEAAVATLMANPTARVPRKRTSGTAIDRFTDSDRVKAAIVHRASLPATIAERLVVMVSEKLQSHLLSHHELSASIATDIVLRGPARAPRCISAAATTNTARNGLRGKCTAITV